MSPAFKEVSVEEITPDPQQPRRFFSEEGLEALANSLRRFGVLQPVVLRPAEGGGYILIAGERRWRAAQMAGLGTLPAVVRDVHPTEDDAYLESLTENLQRLDLNPMEKARALQRVKDRLNWTHEEIGRELGMSRVAVTNTMRLLALPESVQDFLEGGDLSEGHIRPLVALEDEGQQLALAREAAKNTWSVRKMEKVAKARAKAGQQQKASGITLSASAAEEPVSQNPLHKTAAETLQDHLGTKVEVRQGKGSHQLVIHFYDDPSLMDLLSKFPIEEEL